MDDPQLDAGLHLEALRGLARLNLLSGSANVFWPAVAALCKTGKTVNLLDVATGGGDVIISLGRRAAKSGFNLKMTACDISRRALDFAAEHARRQGLFLETIQLDLHKDDLPSTGFDLVTCSLFAHHLDPDGVSNLLRKMAAATTAVVLLQDLKRCTNGLMLAQLAAWLFSRSAVVHNDAGASVHASYTIDEMLALAATAGLDGCTVEERWPCRYLLQWKKT